MAWWCLLIGNWHVLPFQLLDAPAFTAPAIVHSWRHGQVQALRREANDADEYVECDDQDMDID